MKSPATGDDASSPNGANSPQDAIPEMQVALPSIPGPASASKRKASRSTVDALAAEFEQLPHMAEALAAARRDLSGLIGEGESTFRGLRLAAGLSQAGLAARAGLTQSHVALIEGGRNDPTTGTVAKLARALGVNEQLVFRAIRARLERAD